LTAKRKTERVGSCSLTVEKSSFIFSKPTFTIAKQQQEKHNKTKFSASTAKVYPDICVNSEHGGLTWLFFVRGLHSCLWLLYVHSWACLILSFYGHTIPAPLHVGFLATTTRRAPKTRTERGIVWCIRVNENPDSKEPPNSSKHNPQSRTRKHCTRRRRQRRKSRQNPTDPCTTRKQTRKPNQGPPIRPTACTKDLTQKQNQKTKVHGRK